MPSMVYEWRDTSRISIDAQMAGEHIEHLRKRANGTLTPTQVVDDARDPKSVLHPAFEWDDGVAGERYREDQARYLIGCLIVRVKPAGKERSVRAFVNVVRKDQQQGYVALHQAMSDGDLRKQVVEKAWQELREWRQRYEAYSELASMFAAIDHLDSQRPSAP